MSKSKNPYPKKFPALIQLYRFWPDGSPAYVLCNAIADNGWYRITAAEEIHRDGIHVAPGYQMFRPLRYSEITTLVQRGSIILLEEESSTSCDADQLLNDLM